MKLFWCQQCNIRVRRSKIDLFCQVGYRVLAILGSKKSYYRHFQSCFAVVKELLKHYFLPYKTYFWVYLQLQRSIYDNENWDFLSKFDNLFWVGHFLEYRGSKSRILDFFKNFLGFMKCSSFFSVLKGQFSILFSALQSIIVFGNKDFQSKFDPLLTILRVIFYEILSKCLGNISILKRLTSGCIFSSQGS